MQQTGRSLRLATGKISRSFGAALRRGVTGIALVALSACDENPAAPITVYDPDDVEILARKAMFTASQFAEFTIVNRTNNPMGLGSCAEGLELRVFGRWLPVAGPADCDAVLFVIPPGGTGAAVYPLDARLPEGLYRARFSLRQAIKIAGYDNTEYSTSFRVQKPTITLH